MLRNLYDKVIALSESRHALPTLAAVSFAESSFFPIPPDVILVPMALAQPDKARLYALVCTIASVLGGMLGYAIGAFLYDTRRPLADLGLRLWRGHRGLPRGLCQMGRLDHPDQGHDAHPLQDRHHRLGLRRLQLLHVRAAVDHHPRRALLPRGRAVAPSMASRSAASSRSG